MTLSLHHLLYFCLALILSAVPAGGANPAAGPEDMAAPAAERAAQEAAGVAREAPHCLPRGKGYLRARLSGALQTELDWGNEGTSCTGAARPGGTGIRMRFSRPNSAAAAAGTPAHTDGTLHDSTGSENGLAGNSHDRGDTPAASEALVLVFGITGLREGQSGHNLPVNLTVIREGRGQFYSTQGDDKCILDEVSQTPLVGVPRRSRSYRIDARGFCTEPARAVRGQGAVLMSRFDFSAQVDFETQETEDDPR